MLDSAQYCYFILSYIMLLLLHIVTYCYCILLLYIMYEAGQPVSHVLFAAAMAQSSGADG